MENATEELRLRIPGSRQSMQSQLGARGGPSNSLAGPYLYLRFLDPVVIVFVSGFFDIVSAESECYRVVWRAAGQEKAKMQARCAMGVFPCDFGGFVPLLQFSPDFCLTLLCCCFLEPWSWQSSCTLHAL